jgi:hypothetical protein
LIDQSAQPKGGSEDPVAPSVPADSVGEEGKEAAVADQLVDPDALLERWLGQIRAAERLAEHETAAIRIR